MKDEAPPPPEALEAMARAEARLVAEEGFRSARLNPATAAELDAHTADEIESAIARTVDRTWRDFIPGMRAAFTALREAGYAVVPRVATLGMANKAASLQFGFAGRVMRSDGTVGDHFEDKRLTHDQAATVWTAMLSAAEEPTPPPEA